MAIGKRKPKVNKGDCWGKGMQIISERYIIYDLHQWDYTVIYQGQWVCKIVKNTFGTHIYCNLDTFPLLFLLTDRESPGSYWAAVFRPWWWTAVCIVLIDTQQDHKHLSWALWMLNL